MKRFTLILIGCLFTVLTTKADSLWIEANGTGQVGKAQLVKVIFGSYNEYRLQNVNTDDSKEAKDFTCWAISPSGKHITLNFTPKETSYEASFTPAEKGIYVLLLENKQRRVEDWSKSTTKIGIAKQNYYSRTTIKIGDDETIAKDAVTDLSIVRSPDTQTGADVTLQALLHGKPVPNAIVFLRNPGMAEQKFTTNEDGKVSFHSPKAGRYFALVTLKFESPGTYRGIHYDVFREKSCMTMVLDEVK
ncbi:DUF4198 domain-containing protein [Pedobacter sp. L105]|uniref:DUF4198 domain-containing protein n=1 Tax=Pedobacter sp. L105 TaxID=1641871 RepID=UPI00131C3678|nr:DUF4198 domain-containing protein [Pedobacter sp. L105]